MTMFNGFSFNNTHSNSFPGLIVNKIHRPFSAPRKIKLQKIPNRRGALLQNVEEDVIYQKIDITIHEVNQTDYNNLLDSLRGWLLTKKTAELVTDKEPNRIYVAILYDETDLEEIANFGEGTLNFAVPEGIKYGSEKTYNFTNDTVNPVNNGTAKTKPTITATFTATASELKVTHEGTGQYVRVIRNFIAGDVLELDFAKEKITINGIVSMTSLDWANSDFFSLVPGSNTLNATPVGVANTEIKYLEKWK
jgi:predicted phage tail component-like protein